MEYASPMPESFEKSLVRICYLLERFMLNLASGGLYKPEPINESEPKNESKVKF